MIRFLALALALALAASGAVLAAPPHEAAVAIATSKGARHIQAEIADTPELKGRGLMFRRALAPDRGMLFLYARADVVHMWMRNTPLSLDMIFVRADGLIHRIEERTEPFSERIISSGAPVTLVLEVPGGTVRRLHIRPGDRLSYTRNGEK